MSQRMRQVLEEVGNSAPIVGDPLAAPEGTGVGEGNATPRPGAWRTWKRKTASIESNPHCQMFDGVSIFTDQLFSYQIAEQQQIHGGQEGEEGQHTCTLIQKFSLVLLSGKQR